MIAPLNNKRPDQTHVAIWIISNYLEQNLYCKSTFLFSGIVFILKTRLSLTLSYFHWCAEQYRPNCVFE